MEDVFEVYLRKSDPSCYDMVYRAFPYNSSVCSKNDGSWVVHVMDDADDVGVANDVSCALKVEVFFEEDVILNKVGNPSIENDELLNEVFEYGTAHVFDPWFWEPLALHLCKGVIDTEFSGGGVDSS